MTLSRLPKSHVADNKDLRALQANAGSLPAADTAGMQASLSFELRPNFPNPFNPATTIRYTLPEASDVRLTIYNALGQQVRVLVNAAQGPGVYNVQWDGRDASGRTVAAGMYIYTEISRTSSITC